LAVTVTVAAGVGVGDDDGTPDAAPDAAGAPLGLLSAPDPLGLALPHAVSVTATARVPPINAICLVSELVERGMVVSFRMKAT
jgi:hypothetical protein